MSLTHCIRHIRPLTVFYARSFGPYVSGTDKAWKVMSQWLDGQKARSHMRVSYGLFHDNPRTIAAELLRYDACVPLILGLDADASAGIGRQTFGGGVYAVHTHVGAYEATGEIFSRLHREIVPKQGLIVDYDRPFLAIYLTDPKVTREMHRRTEICVPVVPMQIPLNGHVEGGAVSTSAMLEVG